MTPGPGTSLSSFISLLYFFAFYTMDKSDKSGTLGGTNLNATFKKVMDLQSLDERGQVMVRAAAP